ncbi:MAG: dienelactone hydrolase family protein [Candidatus Binataceae bacterium]
MKSTGWATLALAIFAACASAICFTPASAAAGWQQGEFDSAGKPVTEYHCAPATKGPLPAVIVLHGAGPAPTEDSEFGTMCAELAGDGYYTEYIEYYTQTGAVGAQDTPDIQKYYLTWMTEIRSGIDAMDKNPAVDPKRVAIVGFSLGSFLALSTGATDPGKLAAIVEYYCGLPPAFQSMAANLPPTLILHGAADVVVPVAQAHTLDALMTAAKRPHEMHIYPGANHAFNFAGLPMWYSAADAQDAWKRTLAFLSKYLAGRN